jgi:hypothetical protein
MSYASAMHDRMLAALVIPCRVVAVDRPLPGCV